MAVVEGAPALPSPGDLRGAGEAFGPVRGSYFHRRGTCSGVAPQVLRQGKLPGEGCHVAELQVSHIAGVVKDVGQRQRLVV
eukprot:8717192-Heterocapsa_arctica.AAC.1